ncbi:MAG: oligosaccharide flippase family protein [candidate division Zixibacteria bacterium]|nr:oligosaccharide flippase family protein [candidate division Zixibacteria bacterium]
MYKLIKSILKHASVYGLGDILAKGIAFFMIPFYTRFLSTEQYGTLELLDLTSYVVAMILATGVGEAVYRFYYNYDDPEKKKTVISTAMITYWVNLAIGLPLLLLFSADISNLVFETVDFYRLFHIMFITTGIALSNEIPRVFLRIQRKSKLFVAVSLTKLVINLGLNILFIVKYDMGVEGILYGGLIATAIVGIFLLIYVFTQVKLKFSFEILNAMVKYGLPLVLNWLGMFVLHFGDRFLLQRFSSLADVGIYGVAYKFGMVLNFMILTPFLNIWKPKQFEIAKEPDAKNIFANIFTYFCFVIVFAGLGLSVLIKDIVFIMADTDYHSASIYVPVLLLANIFFMAYWFTQVGLLIEKKTKYLGLAALYGAIINVGCNMALIPRLGVWGATITTLVSFSFFLAFTTYYSQRFYFIPYQKNRLIKMAVAAGVLFFVGYSINPANVWVSIFVKSLVALAFPFVLLVIKFYSKDELKKFKELFGNLTKKSNRDMAHKQEN